MQRLRYLVVVVRWLKALGRAEFYDKYMQASAGGGGRSNPHRPPRRNQGSKDGDPSGMAIASLILGVASWFALPLVGAVAGAILGWIEQQRIERGESPAAGRTIARVGFWLSVANIAVSVLAFLAVLALVVFVGVSLAAITSSVFGLVGAGG